MPESSESFFDRAKDALVEKFLKTRRRELDDFLAGEELDGFVAARFRWFSDAITRQENIVSGLQQSCELYVGSSIPKTLYENSRNHPNGPAQLPNLARELMPALLLREHGAAVVKLGEKELHDLRSEFDGFKRDNSAIIQKLGLV
jgi:hypothetical protein